MGIVAKDGVVLGAERRYAYGNYVVSRNAVKVFKITESVGAACAGMVGDMQVLVKTVQAIIRRKQMETGRVMGPNSVAKVMSVLMFENRLFPLLTQVIVGGYAAVGSGEEIAIGVIENDYREDMSVEQAKELALRGIKSALKRDASSGDGIDFLIIAPGGSRIEYVPM